MRHYLSPYLYKTARLIATLGGVGYLTKAPGTLASFLACLLAIPLWVNLPSVVLWAATISVICLGILACENILKQDNVDKDPSFIVVDEFAGQWICLLWVDVSLLSWALAFILFRVLDIFKPFPINLVDRWGKTSQSNTSRMAFGVMADDVAAGVMAGAICKTLQYFHFSDLLL